jgi:hypothetical protein
MTILLSAASTLAATADKLATGLQVPPARLDLVNGLLV